MQSSRVKVISKFGAWDESVSRVVTVLSNHARIERSEIDDWMMSDGIMIFQKIRAGYNNISLYKGRDININHITPNMLVLQTVLSFEVLLHACLLHFFHNDKCIDEARKALYADEQPNQFNAYDSLTEVVFYNSKYWEFTELQCKIGHELSTEKLINPAMGKSQEFSFVVERFKKSATENKTNAYLSQQINDHLILMDQYMSFLDKQDELAASHKVTLFKIAN